MVAVCLPMMRWLKHNNKHPLHIIIIIFSIAVLGITLSACGDNNNEQEANTMADSSITTPATSTAENQNASVDEAVTAYLQLKNALTVDDGKEAAVAGKQLQNAMVKLNNASFAAEQKKVYDEVQADIKEHAEHIGDNASNIEHQREHFDMVSKDMYDLVKVLKPTQTLYLDNCPMYNDNKGANWLSEVKEIKNPYLGKKMSNCGVVKEEIK
jgi:hypothetical protein